MKFGVNPANEITDTMWQFLMDYGQKPNIPALKDYVYQLIKATTQKNGGYKGHKKLSDIPASDYDMILWGIVIEATALVLSGELDKEESC